MSAEAIVAEGLMRTRSRGRRRIVTLAPVSLTVVPGELLAIVGPSLSGKTTLVDLLAGWDQPDEGTVAWPACSGAPPPWEELRVVPQALALVEELTVEENVTLAARVAGAASFDATVETSLDVLGLGRLRDRNVREISVGERQRVMVARAAMGSPLVVLADEPTAHQDRVHAAAVLDTLKALAERGAAVVVATRHEDPAGMADRVHRLQDPG